MSVDLRSLFRKSRRYPIKRDEYGRSARKRAFTAFDNGMRPSQVAREIEISPRTAYRYFADWKKIPENYSQRYILFKGIINDTEFSDKVIDEISRYLGISQNEVIQRLHTPWGIKHYLEGKWPNNTKKLNQSKQEIRLESALKIIIIEEYTGASPEQLLQAINRLIK